MLRREFRALGGVQGLLRLGVKGLGWVHIEYIEAFTPSVFYDRAAGQHSGICKVPGSFSAVIDREGYILL